MSIRYSTLIQFKHVSCAYMSYVDRNSKLECELATNVPSWTLFRLMPNQLQVMDVIKQ